VKLQRRQFLHVAASAAALPAVSHFAWAQAYPTRPVRIVVALAAGGGNDIVARLMGQWLSERLGQQFIVENRPGAGSNIGTEVVVRSTPDGYTLLLVATANALNVSLYSKLSFNFIRDIVPVAGIIALPNIVVVNPSLPFRTIPEFITYAKANPGKISYASAGMGTSSHVSAELFKIMTGVEMVHVPYRGSAPAVTDLLGGQVNVLFPSAPSTIEYIKSGTLRALAVTGATRLEALPDIPTVGEFVPGYEASQWYGIGAPRNTPAEIVTKLNREINAGLDNPNMRARLADLGGSILPGSPANFSKLLTDETEKWGKVIRAADIKAE
jgi:tripartite-type tricarboxylate transporter receptor subunit TctC